MILHTINKSPFETNLPQECLSLMGKQHGAIFIEDGVYGALKSTPCVDRLSQLHYENKCLFFVLQEDLQARGLLPEALIDLVKPIDYSDFVTLCTTYQKIQSWY